MKERISKILESLNENVHERNEVIAVSLLAALSGQNIFLLGPPGTAKSLISRRLSTVFETESYFEYLMQRFSTPEEVFGPVSIAELKKDNYIRKSDGFLPKADFAFLDEIWKSSPAILNTLLTIINEKTFKNGVAVEKVPLKVLVSASNETPPDNQGLDALYDRFLVRLHVPPMREKTNFESLLNSKSTKSSVNIDVEQLITKDEWELWQLEIDEVSLSQETLNVIHDIRLSFSDKGKELDVYVSDRRWQKAAKLLKAAAFFCGRQETNLADALLLRHCLWTKSENRDSVINIVEEAVRNSGFKTEFTLDNLKQEKDELEKEIKTELYYSDDVHETVLLADGNEYFKVSMKKNNNSNVIFYIPFVNMKTSGLYHPLDQNGDELDWINYDFNGQGSCSVNSRHSGYGWRDMGPFTPPVEYKKGDKKQSVNQRLVSQLQKEVRKLSEKINSIISGIKKKNERFERELDTPFVPLNIRDIATESIQSQLHELNIIYTDCGRLLSLAK